MHTTLQHLERWPLALTWLCVMGVVLFVGMRKSPLRPLPKVMSAICKALALSLVAFCVLDPVTVREIPKKGVNEVVILVDDSRSIKEARREGVIRKTLAQSWMTELRKDYRLRIQAVAQRSRVISNASELTFEGLSSRLCSAVTQARSPSSHNANCAAVVLITDGIVTDEWPAASTVGAGAPVFPALVAEPPAELDLSLVSVVATQTAFEDSPVTLACKLQQVGCEGRTAVVNVVDAQGKLLATEKHVFTREQLTKTLQIKVPLTKAGVSFLQVKSELNPVADAGAVEGRELTLLNNSRWVAVDRGSGPYRVLYVGGRPNWDYKYLRRALTADPEVQMPAILRIAKREPKFEWRGRAGETSNPLFKGFGAKGGEDVQRYDQPVLIRLNTKDAKELQDGFPKTAEELLMNYRAIILDDIEAEFFSHAQLDLMERFVSRRGGSLLMLGGQECFANGKYEHTTVGRMLPVYLDRRPSGPAWMNVRFSLTREGWLEPFARLRAEQEADESRVGAMPPFYAVNQTFSIKPGASVLANVSGDSGNHPALITQRFGNGRVTALAIADIWRWGMHGPEQQEDMQRFWRQLVRHLIVDVQDRVEMMITQDGENGQRLECRVKDPLFEPMDDAGVKFALSSNGGAPLELSAEPSLDEPGLHFAISHGTGEGTHLVTAEVKDAEGVPLATKTSGWASNPLADETRTLVADAAVLDRMAQDTKGKRLTLDDLSKLPELLSKVDMPAVERKTSPLWHHPLYLALIVGLLVAEWIIRRVNGWI